MVRGESQLRRLHIAGSGLTAVRPVLVLVHRYVGLAMAGFLLVAGLTGSLLAWKVRFRSGAYKLNFDLHRAGGLWPWAMLSVTGVVIWARKRTVRHREFTPVPGLYPHRPC